MTDCDVTVELIVLSSYGMVWYRIVSWLTINMNSRHMTSHLEYFSIILGSIMYQTATAKATATATVQSRTPLHFCYDRHYH
jgi:hypothetical protein